MGDDQVYAIADAAQSVGHQDLAHADIYTHQHGADLSLRITIENPSIRVVHIRRTRVKLVTEFDNTSIKSPQFHYSVLSRWAP